MNEITLSKVGVAKSRRGLAKSGLIALAGLLGSRGVSAESYIAPEKLPANGANLATSKSDRVGTSAPLSIINVKEFGARGDANADDGPAIQAAIESVRAGHKRLGAYDLGCRLVFDPGVYAVDSTIDLTGLQRINTVIDGGGAAILGRCQGKPVIDALGSRWLTVRDLTVLGDPKFIPTIGIQLGRLSAGAVADDHRFEDVKILGSFTLCCLYNRAAETTGFDHVFLWNDRPDSYCLIQDGVNHFGINSAFSNAIMEPETALSFNENEFINCDFRHGGGGTPIWLGDTARHAFIRCYSATEGGPSFVIYCGSNSHLMLDIDCHCETVKLKDVFFFTGPASHLTVRGFSFRDHYTFPSRSVFNCDSHVAKVEIQNGVIDIASFYSIDCKLFSHPERWSVKGSYYSADNGTWNGADSFTGMVSLGGNVRFNGILNAVLKLQEPTTVGNLDTNSRGSMIWDPRTNKLIIWTGSTWVDALGRQV